MKRGGKPITIKGLIVAADWDEEGKVVAAAISTHEEEEYLIEKNCKGEELLHLLQEEVEVRGVVRGGEGKKTIVVEECIVSKDQCPGDDLETVRDSATVIDRQAKSPRLRRGRP
jgi:hypothetical protein